MKKLYTLIVIVLVGFIGNAQIVTIPDANFKAKLLAASTTVQVASTQTPDAYGYVTTYTKIDTNNDGQIQTSEALAIKWLKVSSSSIADLTGIQSFTNLQTLYCNNNNLTSLNISGLTTLKYLYCSNNQLPSLNVSGLTTLQYLNCSYNQLPSLNVSGLNNLIFIDCSTNQLPSLNVSGLTNLKTLACSSNLLPNLNVSGLTTLQTLNCSGNQLTNLNLTNCSALTDFSCDTNQLTSLDISNKPNLSSVSCSHNLLTSINITGDLSLLTFYFDNNQFQNINLDPFVNLTEISMGANPYTSVVNLSTLVNLQTMFLQDLVTPAVSPLTDSVMPSLVSLTTLKTDGSTFGNMHYNLLPSLNLLLCRNTGLTSLSTIPTTIPQLVTEANQLTSVDLTPFTNLTVFQSYNNPITNVVLGNHPGLSWLDLGKSQLTSIDVSGLPALTSFSMGNCPLLTSCNVKNGLLTNFRFYNCPNLIYICADDIAVNNIQTAIATNAASYNGNPNCHVNTYCSFVPGGTFYTIQGQHRWDTTNNGCDSNDFLFPNMKFNISNGTATTTLISRNDGSYHYDVPTGTYTVTPVLENATYFTVTPSSTGNIVFPTATSPYVRDFCIRSIANNPDLEVVLYPLSYARPGFYNKFVLIYRNKGGIPQNGSVVFNYDDTIQDFLYATTVPSFQTTGSLTWNFTNLLPFQSKAITLILNLNSPTEVPPLVDGNVLNYNATITGNLTDIFPSDNTFSLQQTTENSHDPNDKTCVEGTTITPSMVGQYVHYIVRFENDGTANAQNIVVKDMIDTTKFDVSSLIPLSGSASYTTRITNTNQVEFIFQNINLPFAAGTNTGYVAFKIKTLPTLVVGNTFSNSANIYFDYNFPIVTNTATTTIATLGTQDFDFGSVFTLSPVPAKNSLTITTKQNVVISSLSIYNILGQLVQVITSPTETIDVSGLQSGSYFARISSDKGSATGKFIKE